MRARWYYGVWHAQADADVFLALCGLPLPSTLVIGWVEFTDCPACKRYRDHALQANESVSRSVPVTFQECQDPNDHGPETRCTHSVDGLHCVHWYDGEVCCRCGDPPATDSGQEEVS